MATPPDVKPGSSNVALAVLVSLDSERSNLERGVSKNEDIREKVNYLGR